MKRGRRLSSIPGFPDAVRDGLAQLSLLTAEELVAQAAVDEAGLGAALALSGDELAAAVGLARQALGPGVDAMLQAIADAPDYGHGALPPDDPGSGPSGGRGDEVG